MNAPNNNAFKTAEECAKWLDSISHIEGSYATGNAADWIRHLARQKNAEIAICRDCKGSGADLDATCPCGMCGGSGRTNGR